VNEVNPNLRAEMNKKDVIKKICCCPYCHASLSWNDHGCSCDGCKRNFSYLNGKICFNTDKTELTSDVKFHLSLLENKTLTAKSVRIARKLISSEYEPHKQLAEFLRQIGDKGIIVECGSGDRRLSENVVNVDFQPFEQVDIITDIRELPFCSESVDVVIFDTVLEHVEEPQQCINEAYRILKPGGHVASVTPFIFPYHSYPKHYWNFSEDGLQYLFRRFSHCKVEMNMGPTSALINLISEYIALAFSGRNALFYLIFKGIALTPIFFLKYLDRIWYKSEKAKQIAMCHFTLAKK